MRKKLFIPLIILVLLLIAAAVALIIWAPWKGAGDHVTAIVLDESQPLELGLADGTAIIAPPGSLPEGAAISIKKINPKEAPPLPEGFDGVASLYDFSADRPIKELVTIRIPIPDAGLVVLGHYHNWNWEAIPFNEENGKAVVEVDNLSFFGWLGVSDFADKVLDFFTLRWMDKEPTLTYDSNIVVDESKTYDLISGSGQLIEDNTVKITIYNNAPVHLEVYPVDYPAKSFELKKTGIYTYEEYTILAPNSYGEWTTDLVIDESVTFNAYFSDLALAAFVGDLIPYGRLLRGVTEGALFARNGREMKWADVKSLLIFPTFTEAAKTVKDMKDMPDALLETASIVFTRVESDEPSASEKELIKESDKNEEEMVEEEALDESKAEEIVEEEKGFSSCSILDEEYCNQGELVYDKDNGFIGLGFTLPEGTKIYSPFKGLVDGLAGAQLGQQIFGSLYTGFEILDTSDPEWGWKHQRDYIWVLGGVRAIIETTPMFTENPVEKGQPVVEVTKNQKIITPDGKEYDIVITFTHYDADSNIWSYNEELLNKFFK